MHRVGGFKSMSDWRSHQERSTPAMVRLIVRIATTLRRPVVRPLLYPIVAYFLLTSPAARVASRDFLRRALGRNPRWRDLWKHFFTFASCTLDRIFLLSHRQQSIEIDVDRPDDVQRVVANKPGCLLFVAHFGSAESLRLMGIDRRGLPLSILLDRNHGRMLTELLDELNPELARHVIDASERGPKLVLTLKEAVESGRMLGIMVDRALAIERTVAVDFLGGRALFPVGPWQMAHALGVPIILGFGIYRGGNRYMAHFEVFTERLRLPRESRDAALAEFAQRYAQRLEKYVRDAPYNWFNFYDYWQPERPADHESAAH
jgi:predicted LPLAT superfamily acyltransferase